MMKISMTSLFSVSLLFMFFEMGSFICNTKDISCRGENTGFSCRQMYHTCEQRVRSWMQYLSCTGCRNACEKRCQDVERKQKEKLLEEECGRVTDQKRMATWFYHQPQVKIASIKCQKYFQAKSCDEMSIEKRIPRILYKQKQNHQEDCE